MHELVHCRAADSPADGFDENLARGVLGCVADGAACEPRETDGALAAKAEHRSRFGRDRHRASKPQIAKLLHDAHAVPGIAAVRESDVQPSKRLGQLGTRDGADGLYFLWRESPAQFQGTEGDVFEPEPRIDGATCRPRGCQPIGCAGGINRPVNRASWRRATIVGDPGSVCRAPPAIGKDDRCLNLPLRDQPVRPEQAILLCRPHERKAIAAVEIDGP